MKRGRKPEFSKSVSSRKKTVMGLFSLVCVCVHVYIYFEEMPELY
jgi:hypothetical protein